MFTTIIKDVDSDYALTVLSMWDTPSQIMECINRVKAALPGKWCFDDIIEGLPEDCEVYEVDDSIEI